MPSAFAPFPLRSIPQFTAWNDLQDAEAVAYNLSTVEPGVPLTGAEAATVWRLLQEVRHVLAGDSRRKPQFIRSYACILLNLAADCYERHTAAAARLPLPPVELVGRFKQLVSTDYRHRRRVADYAAVLCVTAKHLSETVKAATNKTAGEWIDEMVLMEAKVQLKQTALSVSQLADALLFSDASAFGKFCRRHTGLAPLAYCRQSRA